MNFQELSKFIFFVFAFIGIISFVIISMYLKIPELTLGSVISVISVISGIIAIYINQKNLTN